MSEANTSIQSVRRYRTSNHEFNVGAMDGGKFNIPLKALAKLLAANVNTNKKLALVPFSTTSKVRLFFDLDKCGEFKEQFEFFEDLIKRFIYAFYAESTDFMSLKSAGYDKYHIYECSIIITKEHYHHLCSKINKYVHEKIGGRGQFELVDTAMCYKKNGYLLRFEGFYKFDTKTDMFDVQSDYYLLDDPQANFDEAFYNKTMLLVPEDVDATPLKSPMTKRLQFPVHVPENDDERKEEERNQAAHDEVHNDIAHDEVDDIEHSDNDHDHDDDVSDSEDDDLSADIHEEKNEEAPQTDDEVEPSRAAGLNEANNAELLLDYPQLTSFLQHFNIRSCVESRDGNAIFFDLKKDPNGNLCPFAGASHSRNNLYLVYFKVVQ
eukprot:533592_1